LKDLQYGTYCVLRQSARATHKSFDIDRAELIERNEARAALKPALNPPRVSMPACRHGSDDDGSQMTIQLVRRNDQAGPSFPYFTAARGIELHPVDFASFRRHLPPLPVFFVEYRRCRWIEKTVLLAFTHFLGGSSPTGARLGNFANHDPSRRCFNLHFLG
jgi:hypothetical protein